MGEGDNRSHLLCMCVCACVLVTMAAIDKHCIGNVSADFPVSLAHCPSSTATDSKTDLISIYFMMM